MKEGSGYYRALFRGKWQTVLVEGGGNLTFEGGEAFTSEVVTWGRFMGKPPRPDSTFVSAATRGDFGPKLPLGDTPVHWPKRWKD